MEGQRPDSLSKSSTEKAQSHLQAKEKQEESKIVDQLSNMNLGETSNEDDQQKFYKLVSESPDDWKFIVDTLKPELDQGKVGLDTVMKVIQKLIDRFDPTKYKNQENLQKYFSSLNQNRAFELENHVFPTILKLILDTPNLFPNQIPLAVQWKSQKVKLSKRQCACLLAHMFMCTIIQQDSNELHPNFNFSWIFSKGSMNSGVQIQKIHCVMNYFTRVSREIRPTFVVFERLVQNESHGFCTLEGWSDCSDSLMPVQIRAQGKIEDAQGAIETDFANKYLGGGVLSAGAVQEEIMFTVSPELLVGMLFFEVMANDEAILLKGTEAYCEYSGYAGSFCFTSNYTDTTTPVKDDVLDREIVAIDAINFNEYDAPPQFSKTGILRELNKAYVGFFGSDNKKDTSGNKSVSTGKWGCGVFDGDTQLKFIIQWLACSRARREMLFYSFGDSKGFKDVELFLERYKTKSVGNLVKDLLQWCEKLKPSVEKNSNLFGNLAKPGK